ncbi:MAG: hypothetical protein UY79_C0020G0006, partial [Parcubacteria group bacterium GW2011_GWA2_53_21]
MGLTIISSGITATGGTITTSGNNTIYTFTSSGTFQVTAGSGNVNYLVVAGGGGGGNSNGGGGGAGGMLTGTTAVSAQSYTVTVGAGGVSGEGGTAANGANSVFGAITATGGGGGALENGTGASGGSGGGAPGYCGAATSNVGAGTSGQGNTGGVGFCTSGVTYNGGGGGGASAVGGAGVSGVSGAGGAGTSSSISGSAVTYAGGGGGGGYASSSSGGAGGGGAGGPTQGVAGTAGTANRGGGGGGGGNAGVSGAGGSGIVIIAATATYPTSGTFTSAVVDLGVASPLSTLFAASTTPASTSISMNARAGNVATPDGTWTDWTSNSSAATTTISSLGTKRYVQYRANLATTDTTATPTLDQVQIGYSQYATSGSLISSKFDTTDAANLISKLSWTATATSSTEAIKFQVRSSADGNTWSSWCGPATACDGTDYFLDAHNGVTFDSGHPLRNGANDRWLQYQVFLTSTGGATASLASVVVTYVV